MCSSCCCSFVHHGRVNRFVLEETCVEITVYEPIELDLYMVSEVGPKLRLVKTVLFHLSDVQLDTFREDLKADE